MDTCPGELRVLATLDAFKLKRAVEMYKNNSNNNNADADDDHDNTEHYIWELKQCDRPGWKSTSTKGLYTSHEKERERGNTNICMFSFLSSW